MDSTPGPRLALGTLTFGRRTAAAEGARLVAAALEGGLRDVDTADLYGGGEAERILGRALKGAGPAGVACRVATKAGLAGQGGLSRASLTAALEGSLARLGRDTVDVFYLHAPDPRTPLGETLDALARLREAGRFRAWGFSNHAAWRAEELRAAAVAHGLPGPLVGQQPYNLLLRDLESEYLPFAQARGIATSIYNPLAGGLLSGAYEAGVPPSARLAKNRLYAERYGSDVLRRRAAQYGDLARRHGLTLLELAYGWLRAQPGVDEIVLGPATTAQLAASLHACARPLPPDLAPAILSLHLEHRGTGFHHAR